MPRLRSHSVALRPINSSTSTIHHPSKGSPEEAEVDFGSKLRSRHVKRVLGESSSNIQRRTKPTRRSNLPNAETTASTSRKLSEPITKPKVPAKPSISKRVVSKGGPNIPKKPAPKDPYSLDELEDSDDEKENIDPQALLVKKKVTKRVALVTNRSPKPKKSVSFSSPPPVFCRPSTNTSILHTATVNLNQLATMNQSIFLPVAQPAILSATPLVSHAPSASTPAVRLIRTNPTDPSLNLSPVTKQTPSSESPEPQSPDEEETEPLVQDTSKLPLEPFTDDAITQNEHPLKGVSSASDSDGGSVRSRKQSDSGAEDTYASWLEEFNDQLKQFESYDLTIDEDRAS